MELRPLANSVHSFTYKPEANQGENKVLLKPIETTTILNTVKELLATSDARLSQQEVLLKTLPESIQIAARQILSATPDSSDIAKGFTSILNCRNLILASLNKLADDLSLNLILRDLGSPNDLVTDSKVFLQLFFSAQDPKGSDLLQGFSQELYNVIKRLAAQNLPSSESLPAEIRPAAKTLPEIAQIWLLAEHDSELSQKNADNTGKTTALLRELAELVGKTFQATTEERGQSILFNLQLPLNSGQPKEQPINIHVFHERSAELTGKPETWLRLSLEPEYVGEVEAIFHLYGEKILDIKVVFTNNTASQLFSLQTEEIREACLDFPFLLNELSVI